MIISGAGWVSGDSYGAVRKGLSCACDKPRTLHKQLVEEGLMAEPLDKAGRFDVPTRRAFCSAALALHDADAVGNGDAVALIATGSEECEAANERYFSDFVGFDRQMGRANLFIYTLPTSPLAEIAIHFKLGGPMFYTQPASGGLLPHLITTSRSLLNAGEADRILTVWTEKELTLSLCWETADTGLYAAHDLPDADTPAQLLDLLKETP